MAGAANRLGRGFGVGRCLVSMVALFVFALAVPSTVLGVCVGDCNNDNKVAINELIIGVNISFDPGKLDSCPSFDTSGNGQVAINELIQGVNNALGSCPPPVDTPTPTVPALSPTPTASPTETVSPTPTETPFTIGAHMCTFAEGSQVVIATQALPLPANPAIGGINIDCGAVAADTGKASCDCTLESFEPINLIGIGFICFTPGGPCPAGEVDCDGGNGLDVTMVSDHNIGTCSGNPDCEAQCVTHCAPDSRFFSGCEGFCIGGANDGLPCTADSLCPGGSCPGKDGASQHTNVCQCDCLGIGGAPSAAGSLQCNLPVNINVEIASPCGDGDILIAVGTRCIPLTTESVSSQIVDANNTPDKVFPDPAFSASGAPVACETLATSVATGLKMIGSVNFADSTIGDLTTNETIICQ